MIIRVGSIEQWLRNEEICLKNSLFGSDNLSIHGGIIALNTGPIIFDIARKLEKLSPKAIVSKSFDLLIKAFYSYPVLKSSKLIENLLKEFSRVNPILKEYH